LSTLRFREGRTLYVPPVDVLLPLWRRLCHAVYAGPLAEPCISLTAVFHVVSEESAVEGK
jgi:hypothetical protein